MSASIAAIVPAINETARISELVCTLFAAGVAEVVVVDGGSTDETATRAAEAGARVIAAAAGRARQMNAGAAASTASVLWFVHADTRLADDAVPALAAALREGATWGRFDVRLSGNHPAFRVIAWFMNRRSRLTGIATGDQGMFVERGLFEAVGGFPDQPLMEDIELSARLRRLHRPACLRARLTTSSRRWRDHGVVRTVLLMWALRLAYWLGVSPRRLHAVYHGVR